jgi:hypothetical protein
MPPVLTMEMVNELEAAARDVVEASGFGEVVLVIEKGELKWIRKVISKGVGTAGRPPPRVAVGRMG